MIVVPLCNSERILVLQERQFFEMKLGARAFKERNAKVAVASTDTPNDWLKRANAWHGRRARLCSSNRRAKSIQWQSCRLTMCGGDCNVFFFWQNPSRTYNERYFKCIRNDTTTTEDYQEIACERLCDRRPTTRRRVASTALFCRNDRCLRRRRMRRATSLARCDDCRLLLMMLGSCWNGEDDDDLCPLLLWTQHDEARSTFLQAVCAKEHRRFCFSIGTLFLQSFLLEPQTLFQLPQISGTQAPRARSETQARKIATKNLSATEANNNAARKHTLQHTAQARTRQTHTHTHTLQSGTFRRCASRASTSTANEMSPTRTTRVCDVRRGRCASRARSPCDICSTAQASARNSPEI